MNAEILGENNLVVNRFFALDGRAYEAGALDVKTKEVLGLVASLVLRFYEDLSEGETARVMGCSVGTIKSQTAKGLARLRTLLDQEDGR